MGAFGDLTRVGLQAAGLESFPGIPDVPPAPFVDPQDAQQAAIQGNYRALPDIERLGRSTDRYNLDQRIKALSGFVPGFTDIQSAGSSSLLSMLRGELPSDVSDEVRRQANARAFAGGFGGSGASGALQARDLGRTSLDLVGMGQARAPGWLGTMGNLLPQQFNVESGFLSPQQQIVSEQWNESNRYNRDWLQNQLDSLPDPETAAIAQSVGQMTDLVASAALAWAGGGIGGMIGGAGGAMGGAQLGGMLGGGGTESSANIGSMIGSMWTPTPATVPANDYSSRVDPFMGSLYEPNMMGGYQTGYGGFMY